MTEEGKAPPLTRAQRREMLDKSAELLEGVVAARPSWMMAHRSLGMAYQKLGMLDRATEQLRLALELGDRSPELQSLVVDHLVRSGRDQEAMAVIQLIEASTPWLMPKGVARQGAVAALRLSMWDSALRLNQSAAGDGVASTLIEAQVRLARGETGPEVERLIKQATTQAPENPQSWHLRVLQLHRKRRDDEALQVIEEAGRVIPDEPAHLKPLTLAMCYEAIERFDLADESFATSHGNNPEEVWAIMEHVNYLIRQRRTADCKPLLNVLLGPQSKLGKQQRADVIRLRTELEALEVSSYSELGQKLKILGGDQPVEKASTPDLKAQLAVSRRSSIRRDVNRTIEVLEELGKRRAIDARDIFQLAELYQSTGRWTESWNWYRRALEASGNQPEPLAAFVVGALAQPEQTAELKSEMQSAIDRLAAIEPQSFRTAYAQARMLAIQGRTAEAVARMNDYLAGVDTLPAGEIFQQMLRENRADYALSLIGRLAEEASDERARQAVERISSLLADVGTAGVVSTLQSYLESPEVNSVIRAEVIRQVGAAFATLGAVTEARRAFEKYAEESKAPDASIPLAGFLAQRGLVQDALKIARGLEGKIPASELANTYIFIIRAGPGTPTQAEWVSTRLRSLGGAAGAQSQATPIQIAIADIALFLGKTESAIQTYLTTLKSDPDNVIALNNLALILSFIPERRDEALKLLTRAIELAGPMPELLDTRALLQINLSEPSKAVSDLEQAIDQVPNNANFLFHLAVAWMRLDQTQKARDAMQRAEAAGFNLQSVTPQEQKLFRELDSNLARNAT